MLRAYIAGAILTAILSLSAALWWQTGRVDRLRDDNADLSAQLRAAGAQMILLRNEMESDREIDEVLDADLPSAVDCRWLLESPCPR